MAAEITGKEDIQLLPKNVSPDLSLLADTGICLPVEYDRIRTPNSIVFPSITTCIPIVLYSQRCPTALQVHFPMCLDFEILKSMLTSFTLNDFNGSIWRLSVCILEGDDLFKDTYVLEKRSLLLRNLNEYLALAYVAMNVKVHVLDTRHLPIDVFFSLDNLGYGHFFKLLYEPI